jgi:predicted RNase H-like HicB family nuclease
VNIKVVVHSADEGGYWAEVPALPGCATQGETMEELLENVREAIHAWLSADIEASNGDTVQVLEIAV